MTVRAGGSNAPLRRSDKKLIERAKKLAAKYEAEGLSKDEAEDRAYKELRDNPRQNPRKG